MLRGAHLDLAPVSVLERLLEPRVVVLTEVVVACEEERHLSCKAFQPGNVRPMSVSGALVL